MSELEDCALVETTRDFKDILYNTFYSFAFLFSKGKYISQLGGNSVLGGLAIFLAYAILIFGFIPAIPFIFMMAVFVAIAKWLFLKFRKI